MGFVPVSDDLTTLRTPLVPEEKPGPRRIEQPESVLGASFRSQNIIGSALAAETYPGKYRPENVIHPELAHDPMDIIRGTKYETDYLEDFIGSESPMETRARMRQIDREEKDRDIRARSGFHGFLADLAAGTLDPTIAFPGGAIVRSAKGGYALGKSMVNVGLAGGLAVTAQEAALQGTQFTRTPEESLENIGAATIFTALLGAGAARWATAAERSAGIKAIDKIRSELKTSTSGLAKEAGAAAADTRELVPTEMVPALVGRAFDKTRTALSKAGELPVIRDIPGVKTAVGLAGKAASAVLGAPEWLIKRSGPLTRMAYSTSTIGKRAAFDLVESPVEFRDNRAGVPTARNGPAVETTARIAIDGARWKLQQELDRLFGQYYFGKAGRFDKLKAKIDKVRGTAEGRMDYRAFKGAVRDALIHGDTHDIPEVQAAAQYLRKEVFDPWKEAAIRAKLLPEDVSVKTAQSYFMRVYDKQKIIAQRPEFTQKVHDWLSQDQGVKAQVRNDLQRNRDLRAERTRAVRKIEKRLETIAKRQDEVEARLGERELEVKRAGKRVEALEDRARAASDEIADLDEMISDMRDTVRDPELKAELQQLERELADLKKADKPVTLADLERLDKEEEAGILTGPLRKAARIVTGRMKAPKIPTFAGWIVKNGGVKDTGGDVLHSIGDVTSAPGLISNKGRSLDQWGEKLTQEFPGIFQERPTPNEVLELIDESIRGNQPQWFIEDQMRPEDLQAIEHAAVIEQAAYEAGIELKSPADVAEMFRNWDPRTLDELTEQIQGMAEPPGFGMRMPATNGGEGTTWKYNHIGRFEPKSSATIGKDAAEYVIEEGKAIGGETIIMLGPNGEIHADGAGEKKSIGFPQEVAPFLDTKGSDLLVHHNHPSSNSFSLADIFQLSRAGMAVVWAHGNNGRFVYRASIPRMLRDAVPARDLTLAIRAARERIDATVYGGLNGTITKTGKFSLAPAAEKLHGHLVNQGLHDAGLIDYFTTFGESPEYADYVRAFTEAGFDVAALQRKIAFEAGLIGENHFGRTILPAVKQSDRLALAVRHIGDMGIPSPYAARAAEQRPAQGGADRGGPPLRRDQAYRKPEQLQLLESPAFLADQDELFQTPEFKRWFGNSKVVDETGRPLILYHGTTSDFGAFDRSRANPESDLGAGFYFSNTPDDVAANYAGEGPDLTNKIERRAEQLFDQTDPEAREEIYRKAFPDYKTGEIELRYEQKRIPFREMAKRELGVQHGGASVPVYLSMKNPVEIGGPKETFIESGIHYNTAPYLDEAKAALKEEGIKRPKKDEIEERARELAMENGDDRVEGGVAGIVQAIQNMSGEFDGIDADTLASDLSDAMTDGANASQLVEAMKKSEGLVYAADPETGDYVLGEVIRRAFEANGYDGFIDHTVDLKFGSQKRIGQPMAGMNPETVHYIAFEPTQIKSVFNQGEFDPDNPNMLAEGESQFMDMTPGGGSKTVQLGDSKVEYGISRDGETAEVILLTTPKGKRGQGSARKAMEQFLQETDRNGLTVFLSADPMGDKPMAKGALEKFYKSLGFRKNAGSKRDFRSRAGMVRDPKKPPAGMAEDRDLPAYRDPTIPIRVHREGMEQTVAVRRQAIADMKKEIEKYRGFRRAADVKAGKEAARADEARVALEASTGTGKPLKKGGVSRGRRGVLQDRSRRLDTHRELMERALVNAQKEIEDLRLQAEEKLLSWQGKSAGDAQAALKRRGEYAAERDRLDKLKNEAGIETKERGRLTSADRAVDAAIKRIIRSDRDKSPDELMSLADEIVDRILGSPDGRLPYDAPTGGPKVGPPNNNPPPRGPLAHREFMIPDDDIKDWLLDDVEQVAHTYLGSIVPDVLLTERFGDVDMTQTFKQINEEYNAKMRLAGSEVERNAIRKEQERVIGDLAAMRDRVRGTYGFTSDTVMRNAARIAGAAGSINTLADMGGSAISQLTDFAGPIFRMGFGTVFRDGWLPFVANLSQGGKGALGKAKRQYNAMGIAIDMHFNTRNLDEVGDQYHPRTKGERMLKGAAQGFMNVNLSAPMTDMAKTIAAVVSGNEIFRATKAVAEGKATPRQITDLAASSIDEEMAGRIWASFQESGAVEDGVYLPNTADWSDAAARRAFEGAVSREVNIAVVTPGQEKALWLSNPVFKILGQFKAFIASSSVRILAANLQRRDAAVLQGLIGSIALGALGYKAYTAASGIETSDRWQDWLKEGISRSGALGWIDEGNSFASKFTRGQLDLYRSIGADKPLSRYASRGVLGALMGPTAGKIENLAQVAGAMASDEFTGADTHAARRLLFMQNLFYIRRLLNEVEQGFNDRFGIPQRREAK